MKREVVVATSTFRIVSLVPSQTELLVDLGLEDYLVGVTKFCIHPKGLKQRVAQIGGTKNVNLDAVRALQPTIIIGNKEENNIDDILALEKEFPVWMSDIFHLNDALEFMQKMGELFDVQEKATRIIQNIQTDFKRLEQRIKHFPPRKVLYYIWRNPNMVAGKQTFIDDMLKRCGLENATNQLRYPEVNAAEDCDVVFLSSEPYPFKEKHLKEIQMIFPTAKVMLVDGEYFSWYGSRLLGAVSYFEQLLDELDK